jgi:hypothetical protein
MADRFTRTAFIFPNFARFFWRVVKKKVHKSDPDVMLNGPELKKCPICVISEEIWSKQEIWATPRRMDATERPHPQSGVFNKIGI